MHNLSPVIRFEITRTLKKKSFWVSALAIPLIMGFVGIIIFFSNKATKEQTDNLAKEHYSVGITDASHLLNSHLLTSINVKTIANIQTGKSAVINGTLDAYFYYPSDIAKEPVQIYGKDVGIFQDGRYQSLADQILKQSVALTTPSNTRSVLQGNVHSTSITYTSNGQIDKGILKLVAPGIFLILFYVMIAIFGNQILMSVTEEKENRVIEMILATIKPTTLLIGKLLSLVTLALIQVVTILVPITIGYFLFKEQLSLPTIDLSSIPLDPVSITLGAVIFITSFLMFTGILMTLGAAMPTAKEASGFFGAIMALTFGPLYAVTLFVSAPNSTIVQVLSYFPLTAPIPLLLRNAVGNLPLSSALVSVSLLIVTTIVVISIGVRIFKFGALEYSRKLSIQEVINRKN